LAIVFNQEHPSNCESAVTKVSRNAEAVAARNTFPGSDSGNPIPAAYVPPFERTHRSDDIATDFE
jgi:hypothetical protein